MKWPYSPSQSRSWVKDLTRAAALLPTSSEVREALQESTRAALPETPGWVVVQQDAV